jgi:hypothetical protein
MTHPSRLRALAGAVVLLAALTTVAGCGDDKTVVTKDDGKVSVDSDDGKVTVDTDEGSITSGVGLPDGFPEDVPLIDEKVITGAKGGPDGQFAWSVAMQTTRAIDSVTTEVKKDFADAGYTSGPGTEVGDISILQFTGDKYDVSVTAARTDDTVTVTYVVRDAA